MAYSMLHALAVMVALFKGVAFGREAQMYDATRLAQVMHRSLAQLPAAPAPAPGSSSWPYGTCSLVLQDADIVVLPPTAGNKDGNLSNFTAEDLGTCCAKCQESYQEWESANLATILGTRSEEMIGVAIEALLKLEGHCIGWTFIPQPSGARGTCYLKNGFDFQVLRDAAAKFKANGTASLESLGMEQDFWYLDERPETQGWYSGMPPSVYTQAPSLYTPFAPSTSFVDTNVTVLRSDPLPAGSVPGCPAAGGQRDYRCLRILGKVKNPPSGRGGAISLTGGGNLRNG